MEEARERPYGVARALTSKLRRRQLGCGMEGNGRNVLVDFAVAFVNLLHVWFPSPRVDLYTCSGHCVEFVLSLRVFLEYKSAK